MGYLVEYDPVAVAPFLEELDLSPQGRQAVMRALDDLAARCDELAADPVLRLAPESYYVQVQLVFYDPTPQVAHVLRVILDTSTTSYGVVRIAYVEEIAHS